MESFEIIAYVFGVLGIGILAFYARALTFNDELQYHQKRNRFATLGLFLMFPLKLPEELPLSYLPNISANAVSFVVNQEVGWWYWGVFYGEITFVLISLLCTAVIFTLIAKKLFPKG